MLKLTSKTRTFDIEINGEVVQYPINTSVSNALRCIESARKAQSTTTRCLSTPLKSFSIGSFLS